MLAHVSKSRVKGDFKTIEISKENSAVGLTIASAVPKLNFTMGIIVRPSLIIIVKE